MAVGNQYLHTPHQEMPLFYNTDTEYFCKISLMNKFDYILQYYVIVIVI